LELLDRLARFIPPPRRHLHRYHAVAVPNGAFGTSFSITTLLAHRGNLLAAGGFTSIGDVPANNIACFDGSAFSSLGNGVANGLNATVRAIAGLNGDIIVSGDFDYAGRTPAGGVAQLTQGQWQSLHKPSSGQSFSIAALLTHQNQLFAGGSFESIGSSAANNVARLDGGFWRTLSPGTGVSVGALSLASIGMDLYVGGNFAQAALGSLNPLSSRGIARWQGNQWGILGDGFAAGTNGSVRAMASFNGDIFAAGNFTTAGGFGDPIRNIARFDGSRWRPLATPPGSAPIGEVRGLAVAGGQVSSNAVRYFPTPAGQ